MALISCSVTLSRLQQSSWGGHKYKVCNEHVHLICGTSEVEKIIAKSSRAQNVRKVKVSYGRIIRHFFLSESEQIYC